MINANQFVNCLWMTAVLLGLGLLPGLYPAAAEAIHRFTQAFPKKAPTHSAFGPDKLDHVDAPRWLAVLGILILLTGWFAYILP